MPGREAGAEGGWREATFEGAPRFTEVRWAALGLGAPFLAFDRLRNERVVIKEVSPGGNPENLAHEFEALRRIAHRNVVRAQELLEGEDELVLLLEHVEGVDFTSYVCVRGVETELSLEDTVPDVLAHLDRPAPRLRSPLDPGPPLDTDRLREALGQLAGALREIHRLGIVHCDVKPQNICVTPEGRVVLLDFGVSRLPGESSADGEGTLVGTPNYMAPERLRGEPASPANDLYAVGVILFEALTGRLPFMSESIMALLRRKLSDAPPIPSELVPGVPADLNQLCVELLDRDPAKRPTADDVIRRLGVDIG